MDKMGCVRVGPETGCWPLAEELADGKLVGIVEVYFPAAWVIQCAGGTRPSAAEAGI